MPKGVYKRTKPHWNKGLTKETDPRVKAISKSHLDSPKSQKHARKMGKAPKTQKQVDNARKMGKLPRTQKQVDTARENGRKTGRINGAKNPQKGDGMVDHHNDLCHGAERPDDVTRMTCREHTKLHVRLRIEDGTHNFLAKNMSKMFSKSHFNSL